jgi:hypothetical protein
MRRDFICVASIAVAVPPRGCVDRIFTNLLETPFTNVRDAAARSQGRSCLWRICIAD